MSRVENILIRSGLARKNADDVMAGQWFDRLGDLAFRFQACQRNRLEARFLGCVLQRLIVQSSSLEEFFRLVAGDPASIVARSSPPLARTRSDCAPDQEFATTSQP